MLGYKGNKRKLVDFIDDCVTQYGIREEVRTAADLFAGTGAVSAMLASLPNIQTLWVNDKMFYAFCFLKARFDKRNAKVIEKRLETYNAAPSVSGFVTKNYTRVDRPFFDRRDSVRIDGIRAVIPDTDYAALGSLVSSTMRYGNVLGKFDTALAAKHLQKNANLPPLHLKPVPRIPVRPGCSVRITSRDALGMKRMRTVYDIVYIDPPYTRKSNYSKEYHVLNTIAMNDAPGVHGQYRTRDDAERSPLSMTSTAEGAFESLLSSIRCKYVCISYCTYCVLSVEKLTKLMERVGFVNIVTYNKSYDKYLGHWDDARTKVQEIVVIGTHAVHR